MAATRNGEQNPGRGLKISSPAANSLVGCTFIVAGTCDPSGGSLTLDVLSGKNRIIKDGRPYAPLCTSGGGPTSTHSWSQVVEICGPGLKGQTITIRISDAGGASDSVDVKVDKDCPCKQEKSKKT